MIPDAYYKDIYSINYDKLKKLKIKNIYFDVDNTLITYKDISAKKELISFIDKLKKDFNIELISNSKSNRVLKVAKELDVKGYYFSMKPLKKNYRKILKNHKKEDCIFVGDQFMTDIIGAKRNGLRVILVDRLLYDEPAFTRFWRFFEKILIKKYKKKKLFNIHEYYDHLS